MSQKFLNHLKIVSENPPEIPTAREVLSVIGELPFAFSVRNPNHNYNMMILWNRKTQKFCGQPIWYGYKIT